MDERTMQAEDVLRAARAEAVGTAQIQAAMDTLIQYKAGKAQLEARVVANNEWWRLRQWGQFDRAGNPKDDRPASGWLFNVLMGKHADGIQAYPEPNLRPREESDTMEARMLTEIIPCILEHNDFEQTYNDTLWDKVQNGTAIWAVLWDGAAMNGLGDVSIQGVDVLNLFWQPGIRDIQDSQNVFYVRGYDRQELARAFPQLEGKLKGSSLTLTEYQTDDNQGQADKAFVVDWYYKKQQGGKTVLHFCKFVDDQILYATENDTEPRTMQLPQADGSVLTQVIAAAPAEVGIYEDGAYPFVFDVLFPVKGSLCGYGYIDLGKSAQEQIDRIDQAVVKNTIMASSPRWFVRSDGAVNEQEFADWTKPFVHSDGNLGQDSLMQIAVNPLSGNYLDMRASKIEELKWVTGNTDVNNGSAGGGVTAASAIAALQEASGRSSKDATKSAYRAYRRMIEMVIERVRQFYDLPRKFRITGQLGMDAFIEYSNANLKGQGRKPVFDIIVSAQKQTEYTKLAQNELALQLYNLGFFNPQLAPQAMACLDMMDFDGKYELMQKIRANGDLQVQLAQWQQYALQLTQTFAPEKADGLAQSILGQGAQPQGGRVELETGTEESSVTANARERAQQAAMPEE